MDDSWPIESIWVYDSLCILFALVPPVAFQRLLSCKDSLARHLKFQQASYNSKDGWSFGLRSCKRWKHSKLKTQKTFRTRRAAVHQHLWYQPLTWCARKQWRRLFFQNKNGNFTSWFHSFCLEMSACGFSSQASRSTWWAMGTRQTWAMQT